MFLVRRSIWAKSAGIDPAKAKKLSAFSITTTTTIIITIIIIIRMIITIIIITIIIINRCLGGAMV